MSPKNDTKVLIGGNVYTLSGDESEEYIQRIALYINNKMKEVNFSENGKQLNTRLLSILLAINIADDLFKSEDKVKRLKNILESKDNIIKELGSDIITLQSKLEEKEKEKQSIETRINSLQDELTKYKNELNEYIELFENEDFK
jgi:cell division protein ZapA